MCSNTYSSLAARIAVTAILLVTCLAVGLARLVGWPIRALQKQKTQADAVHVLLTGTFYNPTWLRSHLLPLTRCPSIDAVTVVCDTPLEPCEKVRYACPPKRLIRMMGRTAARFCWLLRTARRDRPTVVMGYHIMPNALFSLIAARWIGSNAVYQMTGGPVQIIGGGVGSENVLLRKQGKPGRLREALMFHLVRQFDCVVVRGRKAKQFLEERRLARRIAILPGGIESRRYCPNGRARMYDLVAVGRLVPVKRIDRLLAIVAALKALRPTVRVAIAGDGPASDGLQRSALNMGIGENLSFLGRRDDIPEVLRQSRAYILTSENEGLSIAMLEAMSSGLPAIVPDIGDLSDVVESGRNGLLIDPDAPQDAAAQIDRLLGSDEQLEAMSRSARQTAVDYADVDAVADRWRHVLTDLIGGAKAGSGLASPGKTA